MSEYIRVASNKLLNSYAGVQAIIESTYGAIIVEEIDRWKFFVHPKRPYLDESNHINDPRLFERLKIHFNFLKAIIKVPINNSGAYNNNDPISPENIISGKYFPTWFFCPVCERFDKISAWADIWKRIRNKYKKDPNNFHPPKCAYCYDDAMHKQKRRKMFELEQVRFVLASKEGELKDLQWEYWIKFPSGSDLSEDNSYQNINKTKCCEKQQLKYLRSTTFSDLAGIRVKCVHKDCPSQGKEYNLAGLFGKPFIIDGNEFKAFIRTSSSLYYSIIASSIYIPREAKSAITKDDKETIKRLFDSGVDKSIICDTFSNRYDVNAILELTNFKSDSGDNTENDFRLFEYQFFNSHDYFPIQDSEFLRFQTFRSSELSNLSIDCIKSITELKINNVQVGYTRREPSSIDRLFGEKINTCIRYTSSKGEKAEYLIGKESFGEGIFITLESHKINDWIDHASSYYQNNIVNLKNRIHNSTFINNSRFQNDKHLIKYILIHTLSHILIKELEYSCGYPASSISEKIYVDSDNMQGLLLYTTSGADASLGGLTELSKPERFLDVILSAIFRSFDCASDPICINSDGQGVEGMNFAACYSCVLVPETSCEDFNLFLDRNLLINPDFGLFKDVLLSLQDNVE